MPDKPRHKKGRHLPRSRRKVSLGQSAVVIRPPEAAQIQEAIARPKTPITSTRAATTTSKPLVVTYPYINREIRTIAILAGIMLVALIIVALALSR